MSFIKDVSITGGIKDLVAFVRESPKERTIPALLAFFCTAFILFLFAIDPKVNTYTYVPQEVIYVEQWGEDRTDEEIMRDRWEVQCMKDKIAEVRRERMKELGRISGMDVEQIERDAEADRLARGVVEVERPTGLTC